jgi:hypothetical protein
MDDIKLEDDQDPKCKTISLELRFWKTNQHGGGCMPF